MEKAKVYLFTSPTCPHCPSAKKFIHEFRTTRDDFELTEFSTATPEGQRKANKYDVMSVPTFIIRGPAFADPIGLRGSQNVHTMNKYLDIALGKRVLQDSSSQEKKPFALKIGKFRITF